MRITVTEAQSKKFALLITFYEVIFCCEWGCGVYHHHHHRHH